MKLNGKNVFKENIVHLNEELYEQIFNTYYLELVKYVNVLTRNKYDAEDIVNNLFLKLGKIIQTYDYKICNFDSWLFRCVRNETINYLRSQNSKMNKIVLKIPFSRSLGNETDIEVSNVILNIYRIVVLPLDKLFVEVDVTDFVGRYFQMNKKLNSLRLFFEPLIEDKYHLFVIHQEQIELNVFDI